MRRIALTLTAALALLFSACLAPRFDRGPVTALESSVALGRLQEDAGLNAVVADAARATLAASPEVGITLQHMWGTVIDANDPARPRFGQWQGTERVYPASVIKIVFMAHVFQEVMDGDLEWDGDLEQNLRQMIRVSSNVATQRIVDALSGVTDGPRFEDPRAHEIWVYHREGTNRYVRTLGLNQMNANQKTWDELPADDSLEMQFLGDPHPMGYANGNRMTTDETAALMWLIDEDLVVSEAACKRMRGLLLRRGTETPGDGIGPIAQGLPPGSSAWSKDGSTGRFRHDTATVELPDGRRYTLALFTELNWQEGLDRNAFIARWTEEILARLSL